MADGGAVIESLSNPLGGAGRGGAFADGQEPLAAGDPASPSPSRQWARPAIPMGGVATGVGTALSALSGGMVLASIVLVSHTAVIPDDPDPPSQLNRLWMVLADPGDFVAGLNLGKDTHITLIQPDARWWMLAAAATLFALGLTGLIASCKTVAPARARLLAPLHRPELLRIRGRVWAVRRTSMVGW